jgi:hypothetical protein
MSSTQFIHHCFKHINSHTLERLSKLLYQEHCRNPHSHIYSDILQVILLCCIILQYKEGIHSLLKQDIYDLGHCELLTKLPESTRIDFISIQENHLWKKWIHFNNDVTLTQYTAGLPIRIAMMTYVFSKDIFTELLQHHAFTPYLVYMLHHREYDDILPLTTPLSFKKRLPLILHDFSMDFISKKWHFGITTEHRGDGIVVIHGKNPLIPLLKEHFTDEEFNIIRIRYM